MTGLTIEEIAKELGLSYKTTSQRIWRGKHKPLFDGKLYSKDVLKALKKTPSRGRPKKSN